MPKRQLNSCSTGCEITASTPSSRTSTPTTTPPTPWHGGSASRQPATSSTEKFNGADDPQRCAPTDPSPGLPTTRTRANNDGPPSETVLDESAQSAIRAQRTDDLRNQATGSLGRAHLRRYAASTAVQPEAQIGPYAVSYTHLTLPTK